MAIKLDMNKAYDRVEWNFLRDLMTRIALSNRWNDRIMDYLQSAQLSILINGRPISFFTSSQGIHQGCQISPYLFLLCSQGLSHLIKQRVQMGHLHDIKCARNAPALSHLFFADDRLVFGSTDRNTSVVLRDVLHTYETASGQAINLQKSCITFSPNSTLEMKEQIFSTLRMHRNESYKVYLGLPTFSGRSKQQLFDGIKERVWGKLQGWQNKMLSAGGREVLIKAVVQAIPSYTMSIFRLPLYLCQKIRAMTVNFWWGATGDEKRIHWRKWSLLCRQKSQGGMGFRELVSFNQALLAKQAWKFLTNPHSLIARIYKLRYYPSSTFLEASLGHNPSYVWRSLLWGRDLHVKGLRWRITNGWNVFVFKDPWLLRPKSFKPITIPNHNQSFLKVSDLMLESGEWDWNKIDTSFWAVDREEVKRIPVSSGIGEDKLIWHYNPSGEYTVKSGYHMAQDSDESVNNGSSSGSTVGFRKIWNLKLPSKIKIFMWRLLSNVLPVRTNLIRRGMKVDLICPRCKRCPEDITHVFWFCPKARKAWKLTVLWPLLNSFLGGSFGDLFQWVGDNGQVDGFVNFVLICWSIWEARNLEIFQRQVQSSDILAKAARARNTYHFLLHDLFSNGVHHTAITP